MLPLPLVYLGAIGFIDRVLSILPFNEKKTKLGIALAGFLHLFPGIGQYLTPDLVNALDALAYALMGIGASHGIVKVERERLESKREAAE